MTGTARRVVFIASPFEGMEALRTAASEAIERCGAIPAVLKTKGLKPGFYNFIVVADDGNTSVREAGEFTILNRPPEVRILVSAGKGLPIGRDFSGVVSMTGSASDNEDGQVSSKTFIWTTSCIIADSSLKMDGVDSVNARVKIPAGGCDFSLTARDRDGAIGRAEVHVEANCTAVQLVEFGTDPGVRSECDIVVVPKRMDSSEHR